MLQTDVPGTSKWNTFRHLEVPRWRPFFFGTSCGRVKLGLWTSRERPVPILDWTLCYDFVTWFRFRTHVENQNSFNRGTFRNTNKSFNTISRQSTINNRLEVVNKVNYNVPDFHQKEREGIHSWIWYYYLDLHSALQPNNTLWPSLRIDRVSRDRWIEMTFSRHLRASLKSSPPSPLSLSSFSAFQKCSTIVVRLLPTELLTRGGDWYSLW